MASGLQSSHIDARRSNFTNVGRDQNNFHVDITVNFTSQHVRRTVRRRPRPENNISMSADGKHEDEVSIRRKHQPLHCHPDDALQWPPRSSGAVADNLIVQIVQLLLDRRERGTYYQMLELELEPLRQTLNLTNLAIRTYERTPLGRNLKCSVFSEVEQICVVLQELFDRIGSHRQALWPTSIRTLWYEVWWRGRGVDDRLVLLRSKLVAHQQLLGSFLMALNS